MFQWLKKAVGVQSIGADRSSGIVGHAHAQPRWTPRDYRSLATEGYQYNVIVFRAINLIARGISGVKWNVKERGMPLDTHPLMTLIRMPNLEMSWPTFLEKLVSHILLSGNGYVEKLLDDDGQLVGLTVQRPDQVRVVTRGSHVVGFEISGEGERKRHVPHDPISGQGKILHLKLFHPLNDWYGMSPVEAAAKAIDQHNAVSAHNLAVLQHGGRPSAILQVMDGALNGGQRSELTREIREAFQGTANAGQIVVLEGNMQWKEMGMSLKDLDFIEGKHLSAREIAQAFGVPPMLVGVPGDATFSNYREARYHLWEDTILPHLEKIKGELNGFLTEHFGGAELDFDTESIPALAPKRENTWARVADASFLSDNEKRRAIGYPERDE